MKDLSRVALIGAAGLFSFISTSTYAAQEDASRPYQVRVEAEWWSASTKIDEQRQDRVQSPALYVAFEHQEPYWPNVSVRYTSIEGDYAALDKFDYTFYYSLIDHDLLHFDAGASITQYTNTQHTNADTMLDSDFDTWHWSWHLNGQLTIPNSQVDIIGRVDFGNSSDLKTTDFMAGLQYRIPFANSHLGLRGGYRVIDLEFTDLTPEQKEAYIFIDGWFASVQYVF
ncbi:hypothetical protein BCU68_12565 [Vibrio sp. 10N.286.49.B3]|uniref:TIGR04219 family outer membrane beta-barrel protein n=1 Tax=Vibrio sp. 10N.286.49.B3 TaxID=1880855 RepID=UPI000C823EEA|nr:TIGR04219 family outer membrane beta-barrel protein [Vibrio sp. 10N.286.49.B3]PMH44359.1 hypothetical protein BCU68_12565 [Vibrio sp. 10N.286.49.B3]